MMIMVMEDMVMMIMIMEAMVMMITKVTVLEEGMDIIEGYLMILIITVHHMLIHTAALSLN